MKYLLTFCLSFLAAGYSGAQLNNYTIGQAAPDFTVTDLHGQSHQLSQYAGKWVVIDFFAWWCGPCASVALEVNEIYQKYGCNAYDVVALGIEYDGMNADVAPYESGLAHPTPIASGLEGNGAAVHAQYGVAAFPTVVVIAPDGTIIDDDTYPTWQAIESTISNAGGANALVVNNCSAAGITELTIDAGSVFPNPTTGMATINVSVPNSATAEVTIYAISGEQLAATSHTLQGGSNTVTIDLGGLEAGTYFVRIGSGQTISGMIPVVKR